MVLGILNPGSYLGIILFLILTGCGLPIPEEVPIIAAGVFSAQGKLVPWLAFASCLVGALIGDCIMYGIGYRWGHGLLKDHPRFAHLLHAEREARFERMIQRHGLKVLFVARFMVGVRSPVYLSAGILRVPFRRFLAMDLLCATSVVGLFFGLSYVYGQRVAELIRQSELALTLIVVATVGITLLYLYWRRRKRLARMEEVRQKRSARAAQRLC